MTVSPLLLSLNSLADNKNSVIIGQVSGVSTDNLNLNIEQIGYNNKVNLKLAHNSNALLFKQTGNNNEISWVPQWGQQSGGDLDGASNSLHFEQSCTRGSSCAKSDINMHIYGDSNSVRWGQGMWLNGGVSDTTFANDGDEGGGHTLNLDIHGSSNSLAGYQRNGNANLYSAHTATVYFYSSSNSFYVVQETDGTKTASLKTYNNGNTGSLTQSGSGAHNAAVILNGAYPTTFNLNQQSNSAQSYSLTQNCQTSGGCSVSVTQN